MMGMEWAWLATGLLVLAALGAVVLIAFAASRSAARAGAQDGAEELLAQRYARGEIDEAEYRRRRDTLAGAPPEPSDP